MDLSSVLLAALGIGFLIFVHEFGHFLAARLAGVRVERFSLGFGPRLCGFVWRGTDFRLSAVPFGGYVMVAGQDPADHRWPASESLHSKSAGQRTLFWCGGVLMNLLFAFVAFPLVFTAGVDFTAPVVGAVERGGACWEAGIAPGERIVAIGGKRLLSFDNLFVEAALTGGRPTPLRVRNEAGQERDATVLPQWNKASGLFELGVVAATTGLPKLRIAEGSAAAAAGLAAGDVLLAVDGMAPVGATLPDVLATLDGVAPFVARVRSGDAEREVRITPRPTGKLDSPRIGVQPLPRQVRGIRQGASFVERLGLQRGDVLLAIDGVPFTGGDLAIAATGPATLRVHVRRGTAVTVLEQPASAADRADLAAAIVLRGDDSLLLLPSADAPAALAGIRAGERIAAIDGRPVRSFDDLRQAIERSGGRPLPITVASIDPARAADGAFLDAASGELRLDHRRDLMLTAQAAAQVETGLSPQLAHRTELVRAESFGAALTLGTRLSLDMLKQLYVTLKRMVTGDVGAKNLGGIIRISQVSYQAAQRGPSWFFYLLAMLSLNLAFVNLLPIPVLDGGHLLFVLIEKIKGSPVSERVFGYSQVVGLVFVLMLLLFVTYNDILQLF